jgi:hypothetical protein
LIEETDKGFEILVPSSNQWWLTCHFCSLFVMLMM